MPELLSSLRKRVEKGKMLRLCLRESNIAVEANGVAVSDEHAGMIVELSD